MTTTMCNKYLPNLTESSSVRRGGSTTFWCSSSVFGIRHFQSPASYQKSVAKVLQSEILPEFKPFKNQRLRCAEVPWVKASGTT
jgi:hypothetical protein